MKYTIFVLIFLASCASTPEKENKTPSISKNANLKKTKPLTNADITDFYPAIKNTLNPALQDETVDRFTKDELATIKLTGDPLVAISVHCSKNDFKSAFEIASQNFNSYLKVAPYWNVVANCHLNQGNFRKALLFYNKALEVTPNYVPALNNIGVMYSRLGEYQKGLVAFEKANKISKFSKTPRYNLAKVLLTYGMAESALVIFKSLLSQSPDDVDLLNATAACYFLMSDYQSALGYYNRIPSSQLGRAEIGLNFALTLKKTGKPKEAQQIFANVKMPKSGNLKKYYSIIQNKLGDAE
jgi:tetratricopeptide (TPR) repeat protein